MPDAVITVPLLAALYGMLGAGLGLLLRNRRRAGPGTDVGVRSRWNTPGTDPGPGMVGWLPEAAANAVLHGAPATPTTLTAGAALAVLAGYTVVLATGGAIVTTRREIGTSTG